MMLADRREIWDWAAEHVDFGNGEAFKGHYDVENVPWTREMLRAFRNPYVREITFIAPPQESGKTKGAEVCIAHRAATQPAKMAFNAVTNVKALGWQEMRFNGLVNSCRALERRLSDNPDKRKRGRVIFRDSTFLIIQGAENDANRQADSVEVQINDECHLWERPWMTQMHSRTRAYKETRKILNISVGGNKRTELEERFLAGNQLEWHHHCPACGKPFRYIFDSKHPQCNIRFDMSAAKVFSDGRLDLREFAKTVHAVCPQPHCGTRIDYDVDLIAKMNRNGVYIPMNPDANPEVVSMHINSFAIGRRPWWQILEPWVRMSVKGGVFAPDILRAFICEELAEFWEDRPMIVSKDIRLGGYRRADVLRKGSWADEWIRVMTIDNQRGARGDVPHRWFVCRAFAKDGRSRLIDCGRINEWEDVRKKQLELEVNEWTPERPGPWVCVDRRHDPTTIDEICARYKWFGMMGSDRDEFQHSQESPYAGNLMEFTEPRTIDIGFGTREQGRQFAVYYIWSSQKVQDRLAILRSGKAEAFEVPSDIAEFCPEYAEQINSHRQVIEQDQKGNDRRVWKRIGDYPDHIYDCESECVVIGLMAGVFKRD